MFHSRKLNNRINNIKERALRIVYRDYESTFQQLLKQNKSVSIHQRNLQILATEIFKTKNGLNPVIMEDVFKFKNLAHNFQNADTLNRSNVNSVKYGTEAITSLGAKIWKILHNDYEDLTSLSNFKSKIKNWEKGKCPCRLCKTYPASSFYLTGHCYVRSMFAKHHFCFCSCLFVVAVVVVAVVIIVVTIYLFIYLFAYLFIYLSYYLFIYFIIFLIGIN